MFPSSGLEDIRKIVQSMQSLAYIETRKLSRRLETQQRLVQAVEQAAADFLAFHPDLLPPFGKPAGGSGPGVPPLLNLPPDYFLLGLVDHYLLATLHEARHASLMAEDRRRIQQLEAAGRHLDGRLVALERRCRQLRQEEIIEEIEVILLGAIGSTGHLRRKGTWPQL